VSSPRWRARPGAFDFQSPSGEKQKMDNGRGYFFARSSDVQTSYRERDSPLSQFACERRLGMWIREGGHYRGNCTDTESLVTVRDSSSSIGTKLISGRLPPALCPDRRDTGASARRSLVCEEVANDTFWRPVRSPPCRSDGKRRWLAVCTATNLGIDVLARFWRRANTRGCRKYQLGRPEPGSTGLVAA